MKVIVATGGSDGLGKALAEGLSQQFKVIIIARNEKSLKEIATRTGCEWFKCDVKDAKQVETVFEQIDDKYGSIDVLINNAGVIVNGELPDTSDQDIENIITTNTLGSIYAAKYALKYMEAQKNGLIINVISQSGLNARARRSVYNASKWALTGFTKALQEEAIPYGVRVTGFYPGTMQTKMFAKAGIELKGSALNLRDAVTAIKFLLSLDDDIQVPELGIKPVQRLERVTISHFKRKHTYKLNLYVDLVFKADFRLLRSIEKLRTIASEHTDLFQKEVFRDAVIISAADDGVQTLLEKIKDIS